MKKIFYFVIMSISLLLASCSDDGGSSSSNDAKLTKLDLSNASTLFIAPGTTRSTSGSNVLYKITDGGVIQQVSYLDENGDTIKNAYIPSMIYTIKGSAYFIATFNMGDYLINKTSGAVYALGYGSAGYIERTGGYQNSDYYVTDAQGNIYYEQSNRVYKLDITNPSSVTLTPLTSDAESAWGFTVSSKGDVLYRTNSVNRVRMSNGGLYNVGAYTTTFNSYTGLNGKIKYTTNSNAIYTINIDDNYNATTETQTVSGQIGGLYNPVYQLRFSNRIIILNQISPSSYGQPPIQEVDNISSTPKWITLSYNISSIKLVANTDSYYYLSGLNSSSQSYLIKVDPATNAVTELLTPGKYDIYKMTVSSTNEVLFNALRMSDGVKVIGKISASGTLQILDQQINSEVTVLERIQ